MLAKSQIRNVFKSFQLPFTHQRRTKKMPHVTTAAIVTATAILLFLLAATEAASGGGGRYHRQTLDDACRATLHRSFCVHSLSSVSHPRTACHSPRWWANAALSLAAADIFRAASRLPRLRNLYHGRRAAAALADCVDCLADAAQQLKGSLEELQRLEPSTFELQMGDVQTWVSAALTDEDTCIDGLTGGEEIFVAEIRRQVLNTTYYTSNALALVNSLASAGERE